MTTPLTTTATPHSSPQSTNFSSIRVTKRKLDDAFQYLDDVVGRSGIQQPPKRSHTFHSIYSTLAKYGIRSKETRPPFSESEATSTVSTSKNTPHLTAILTRAATRTRKALKFAPPAPLPPTAEYRPSSVPGFLSRLATFKLTTYSKKPSDIDAVAAAKCGWINEGKDRLVCGLCKSSWIVAGRNGMGKDAASALVEKQRIQLVQMHKEGCPWKTRQCDPSIYRIPLTIPSAMVRDIKTSAITLDPLLTGVEVKHPLTSTQMSCLRSTIHSFELPSEQATEFSGQSHNGDVFVDSQLARSANPSDTAILVSLFGWNIAPTAQEPFRKTSLSRAPSVPPSATHTPFLRRASTLQPTTPTPCSTTPHRPGTSTTPSFTENIPQTPPVMTPIRIPSTSFRFRTPLYPPLQKEDTTLLHCVLCQRRVGLWAFSPAIDDQHLPTTPRTANTETSGTAERFAFPPVTVNGQVDTPLGPKSPMALTAPTQTPTKPSSRMAQRQFDLLKEHRSYCPYIVRSTVIPTLPIPPPSPAAINGIGQALFASANSSIQLQEGGINALEGWRAVLIVVLRYGSGQRKRMGLDLAREFANQEEEPMEVDGIKTMVEEVKSRGGRDLLRYVKGLLG